MLDVAIELDRRELSLEAVFSVDDGERMALFGPSGAGKTSILEVIAGLVPPTRGRVSLRGRELTRADEGARIRVPPWTRRVGLLRQDPGLFPHLSVRDNITYSHAAACASEAALLHMAERLEIVHLLEERPRALSGGQGHRVALARLLLAGHQALLLDEPYTGLDSRLRRVLTDVVRTEALQRSVPSLLVAHELEEAQAFADRLAVVDAGRILQMGSPADVVRLPATRRVAELVGYLGFVPASVLPQETVELRAVPAGAVMGVHHQRTQPGAWPDLGITLRGPVTGIRPAGTGWEVDLSLGPEPAIPLTCWVADDPPPVGAPFVITVLEPPWFDSDGLLVTLRQRARS